MGLVATVTLNHKTNVGTLLAAQCILVVIFLVVMVVKRPYKEGPTNAETQRMQEEWAGLGKGWADADKAQVVGLLALLAQHVVAAGCVAAAGDSGDPLPLGWEIFVIIIGLATIFFPVAYIYVQMKQQNENRWTDWHRQKHEQKEEEEEEAEDDDLYDRIDTDRNGELSLTEVLAAIDDLGLSASADYIRGVWAVRALPHYSRNCHSLQKSRDMTQLHDNVHDCMLCAGVRCRRQR